MRLVFLAFNPELHRLQELRRNISHHKQKLAESEQLLHEKMDEVQLLKSDPKYLETIARDRLDMMKEGEMIYHFDGIIGKSTNSH
ncbi:MAG: septum formation initiator family protein [Chthoniobacterales bacterium]